MRNQNDEEDLYDYSPNELARLSRENFNKYREIVESNLDEGDTIERWQERNREYVQRHLCNCK